MKKLFFLCVLLITQTVFATDNEVKGAEIQLTPSLTLIPKVYREKNAAVNFKIEIYYPYIVGTLNSSAEKFNEVMTKTVNQEIKQFKASVKPSLKFQQYLTADYDVDVIKPEHHTVISIRLSTKWMQQGMAHPAHEFSVFNYDLTTGHLLTLSDLFKPHSDYLLKISTYAAKILNEKLQKANMFVLEGTAPNLKNYAVWNIEPEGLLITFEEATVAPRVYGAEEVSIPFKVLKDIVEPSSPIALCVEDEKNCEVD